MAAIIPGRVSPARPAEEWCPERQARESGYWPAGVFRGLSLFLSLQYSRSPRLLWNRRIGWLRERGEYGFGGVVFEGCKLTAMVPTAIMAGKLVDKLHAAQI